MKFIFVLIVLSCSIILSQNKYFVTKKGNGSFVSVKEVNDYMNNFKPGDQILFNRGETFDDAPLTITKSGANGNEIIFSNYGSGKLPIIGNKTSTKFERGLHLDNYFYIIIDGLQIHASENKSQAGGVLLKGGNLIIRNCKVVGSNKSQYVEQGTGIAVAKGSSQIQVLKNEVTHFGTGVVVYSSQHILVEGNKVHDIQKLHGNFGSMGIRMISNNYPNGYDFNYTGIIRNNEVYDFSRYGIDCALASRVIIENNHVHSNKSNVNNDMEYGSGLKVGEKKKALLNNGSVGNIIRYNIINNLHGHKSRSRNVGITTAFSTDGEIYYNLIYDIDGHGITRTGWKSDNPASSESWNIYNNTIIAGANGIYTEYQTASDTKFKNNIIAAGDGYAAILCKTYNAKFIESNNLFTNRSGYSNSTQSGVAIYNPDYSSVFLIDATDIQNQSAQFVDESKGDYQLNTGSPAINAGINLGNDKQGSEINLINLNGSPINKVVNIGSFDIVTSEINSLSAPTITLQPKDQTGIIGSSITFSVSATCKDDIGYQWWKVPFVSLAESKIKDNSKYQGATTNSLTIKDVNSSDNKTRYLCEVYNTQDHSNHWINSEKVELTVTPNSLGTNFQTPVITKQPESKIVKENETVTFTVEATCDNEIGYQWWKSPFVSEIESKISNNSKYNGVESKQLTIKNVQKSDANISYECEIYNKSDRSTLNINSNIVGLTIQKNTNFTNHFSELKVFLEGPFKNNGMLTVLNSKNFLPKTQPFNLSPFNYSGFQKVNTFDENLVDWILLELRSDKNTPEKQFAALLRNDGIVLNTLGAQDFTNHNIKDGNYFLVIHHRNHLSIMSKSKISIKNSVINYNFSTSGGKTYGTNSMIELENGSFAMYSGNGDANKVVSKLDFGSVANNILTTGYQQGDFDFNGVINVLDYSNINKNISIKSNVP